MPFRFEQGGLAGTVLIYPTVFDDQRGFLMETYRDADFAEAGIDARFIQTNLSRSHRGVVRGLHYQKEPKAQAKLIHVLEGEIYDVVVDLRKDSQTFSQVQTIVLSAEEGPILYIPAGFAHGFCAMSETALVSYSVNAEYSPDLERGIRWNDPGLGISWPVEKPIVSPRDQNWPMFAAADVDA